jgi:hypothetical protein
MGAYMKVVLKDKYNNEAYLARFNNELKVKYGSPFDETFCSMVALQNDADYYNNDPEGIEIAKNNSYLKDKVINKEITAEYLKSLDFFWWSPGTYECKLNGCYDELNKDAMLAMAAVCRWSADNLKYIDILKSSNYLVATVRYYMDENFKELGMQNPFINCATPSIVQLSLF